MSQQVFTRFLGHGRLASTGRARSTRPSLRSMSSSATTTRAGRTSACSSCSTFRRARPAARPRGDPGGARADAGRGASCAEPGQVRPAPARATRTRTTRPTGRKCEFGPSRADERAAAGHRGRRERLRELLGDRRRPDLHAALEPLHGATPARCLAELGFPLLSRESRAEPLGIPGLRELPVHLDWVRRRRPGRAGPARGRVPRGRPGRRDVPPRGDGRGGHAARRRAADLVADHPRARPAAMAALLGSADSSAAAAVPRPVAELGAAAGAARAAAVRSRCRFRWIRSLPEPRPLPGAAGTACRPAGAA